MVYEKVSNYNSDLIAKGKLVRTSSGVACTDQVTIEYLNCYNI